MKNEFINLNEGMAEIIYGPSLNSDYYLLRLRSFPTEKVEIMINRDDMGRLAELFNRVLENTQV